MVLVFGEIIQIVEILKIFSLLGCTISTFFLLPPSPASEVDFDSEYVRYSKNYGFFEIDSYLFPFPYRAEFFFSNNIFFQIVVVVGFFY